MRNTLTALIAAVLFPLSGCAPDLTVRPPAAQAKPAIEAPPCVPEAGLLPGAAFSPEFDEVRTAAIKDLLQKVAACTPLPFNHDGIIFGNREGRLPAMPRGHYKEYTLVIPSRKKGDAPEQVRVGTMTFTTGDIFSPRGPERLVIGGGKDIYYSPDHYLSFVLLRILP